MKRLIPFVVPRAPSYISRVAQKLVNLVVKCTLKYC